MNGISKTKQPGQMYERLFNTFIMFLVCQTNQWFICLIKDTKVSKILRIFGD